MDKISKNQKGFNVIEGLLALIVICVLGIIGWQIYSSHKKSPDNKIPTFVSDTPYSKGVKFRATITADGCATSTLPVGDVGCSITVNSALQIFVVHGNAMPQHPWGSVPDTILNNNSTGKTVDVYAHQLSGKKYTLEGSSDYYVRIVN